MAFSHDGLHVISGGSDKFVVLWRVDAENLVQFSYFFFARDADNMTISYKIFINFSIVLIVFADIAV
jgi:WD40 repeat protein